MDVRRSAARHRRSLRAAAAVLVVVALVAAVAVLARPDGSDRGGLAVPDVPLQVSALADTAPLGDTARGAVSSEGPLARPGKGTLVGVVGDDEVWLTETASGEVCLLAAYESAGSAGVSCQPRSDLLSDGVLLVTQGVRPGAPLLVAVAVPDGYTRAEAGAVTADVRRGTAVLAFDADQPPAGSLRVSGPDVPAVSFPLDGRVPQPGSASAPGRDALAGPDAQARRALVELVRRADAYAEANGSTAGFVDSLPDEQRDVDLRELTDARAVARVEQGCLEADLRTGALFDATC